MAKGESLPMPPGPNQASISSGGGASSASSVSHDRGMQQLIPIVNKLQDVFAAIGKHPLDLPQIVVIGKCSRAILMTDMAFDVVEEREGCSEGGSIIIL